MEKQLTIAQQTGQQANVGALERIASTAIGGLLIARGIQNRSLGNLAGALIGADLIYRGVSGHCAIYGAMGLNTAATGKSGSRIAPSSPEIERSVTIGKSPEELAELWLNPANLARIVSHFAEVTPLGNGLTHWRVRGPLKQMLEWDSRTEKQSGNKIWWQSLPGSTLPNHGDVTFRPGPDDRGTIVTLRMQFEPPLGSVGAGVVKALDMVPRSMAGEALRRFKSLAETGEIPTIGHNPSGRGDSDAV